MCKSKAEGGQRCANHALNRVTKADQAIRDAKTADQALRRVPAYREALVEYASTPQGQVVLTAMYQDARQGVQHNMPLDPMQDFRTVLAQGYRLRQENAAAAHGLSREHIAVAPTESLSRYGNDDQADVPVESRLTRREVNFYDGTFDHAPVSHYAKAHRQATAQLGKGSPSRAKGNDPAFMRTKTGQVCEDRPRNTFHDVTTSTALASQFTKASAAAGQDRAAQEALRADLDEQQYCLKEGHYPVSPSSDKAKPANAPSGGQERAYQVTYEKAVDGSEHASVQTDGYGSVDLGYPAPGTVFDDGEVRAYVDQVVQERKAAAAATGAGSQGPVDVAGAWDRLLGAGRADS